MSDTQGRCRNARPLRRGRVIPTWIDALFDVQPVIAVSETCFEPVQLDLTRVDLEGVLPSATIMVVTVTASTTAGQMLSEAAIAQVCCPGFALSAYTEH